jgi:hypothetical protein
MMNDTLYVLPAVAQRVSMVALMRTCAKTRILIDDMTVPPIPGRRVIAFGLPDYHARDWMNKALPGFRPLPNALVMFQ